MDDAQRRGCLHSSVGCLEQEPADEHADWDRCLRYRVQHKLQSIAFDFINANRKLTCESKMSREPEAILVTAKICIVLAKPSKKPMTKYCEEERIQIVPMKDAKDN